MGGADALTMAPQVGDTITGAVMDPDGDVRNRRVLAVGQDHDAGHDGELDAHHRRNHAAYTVMEGDTGYYLRVMATYTDAVGTDMAMVDSMPTMMVTMMTVPMFETETAQEKSRRTRRRAWT